MELPSPPPPEPAAPPPPPGADSCASDRRYDRYLSGRQWTAREHEVAKGIVDVKSRAPPKPAGYVCYQHRNVSADPPRHGRGCPRQGCPTRHPTFPTTAGTCLCCPMKGHLCPPCWGCLMPLSRRRAFGGKLYERETGGTANVYLAVERLRGEQVDVVFKLRAGEVTDEERESTRLVEAVGERCGLVRPAIALEWVADLTVLRPPHTAPETARSAEPSLAEQSHAWSSAMLAGAERHPAVAAELARGVSADMLLRSHTFGPNKQERQGRRARDMVHQMRRIDSRAVLQSALFDALFASGDRHLEHVMLQEGGGLTLIDNAHTILESPHNTRHTANSLFLPGANFQLRNKLGFPFLHCCTLKSTCPVPKPPTCPERHTLYWPALLLDYRCHAPRGRVGHAMPPKMHACLHELATTKKAEVHSAQRLLHSRRLAWPLWFWLPRPPLPRMAAPSHGHLVVWLTAGSTFSAQLASSLGVPGASSKLARLIRRAELLLEKGFEGALRSTAWSPVRRATRAARRSRHSATALAPPPPCTVWRLPS